MKRYKNNLSDLVSTKLPDFVQDEHPNFVRFVEEYYKWLELPDNPYFPFSNIEEAIDIDETIPDFLDYFKKLVFDGFPENYKSVKGDEVDVALLIKKIRSFYSSKGTEASIKFLMKLLFDVYSEVYIPYDDVFKTSSGFWYEPKIVRCIDGNPTRNRKLKNVTIKFYNKDNINVGSAKVKTVKQFNTSGYNIIELDIVEIVGYVPSPGSLVYSGPDGFSIRLDLIPMISSIKVGNGGRNYSLDDNVSVEIFEGASVSGFGCKASVESITKQGSIRSIRIDDPGFFYDLNAFVGVKYVITVNSETGVGASGLEPTISCLSKRAGVYLNNNGKLSSATEKIQDNYRYQIHSYVVRTEATLPEYEKTLRNLTHPAGKLVLGDYFVYRKEYINASTGGFGIGGLGEPYFANYFPYTIAEVSDGATTEVGSFGILPSDYDLRGVSSDSLLGPLTDPPIYADYFPFGYDGSTGYTIVSTDEFRSASGDGISSGWENQNFNIFGGVGATQEFFSRKINGSNLSYVGVTLPGWPSDNTAFWIVYPHPNTWHGNVPAGSTWGGIVLQDFIRSPYKITSPPVRGSSNALRGTLGQSPSIPSGYGEGI